MDYKKLIEKYWNGETSIAEEQSLKAYFNSEEVSKELLQYAPIFQYLGQAKKETFSASIPELIRKDRVEVKRLKVKSKLNFFRRIAAAILLLVAFSFVYSQFNQPTKAERLANYWAEKEIKDPKLAYQKTKAALLMVSKKLNGGTAAALNQVRKVQQISPLNIKTQ